MKTNNNFYSPSSINMYFGNSTTVLDINSWYQHATIFDDASFLFKNKSDAILGIRKLPLALVDNSSPLTQMQAIGLGKGLENPLSNTPIEGVKISSGSATEPGEIIIPARVRYLDFHVDRKFNTFLDYEPYTRLQLYLPLIGIVNLDTNSVMDKDVNVTYIFDYLGNTVATEISVIENGVSRVIQTDTGVLGYNIPYTYVNSEEMSRNLAFGLLKTGLSVGAGLVGSSSTMTTTKTGTITNTTSGSQDIIKGGAKTKSGTSKRTAKHQETKTTDIDTKSETKAKRKRYFDMFYGASSFADTITSSTLRGTTNIAGTNIGYYESLTPTLTRVTITNWYPSGFGIYYGYPLKQTKTIGELVDTGFTVFEEIHVDNVDGATFEEKDMIENYLKEGVLL